MYWSANGNLLPVRAKCLDEHFTLSIASENLRENKCRNDARNVVDSDDIEKSVERNLKRNLIPRHRIAREDAQHPWLSAASIFLDPFFRHLISDSRDLRHRKSRP